MTASVQHDDMMEVPGGTFSMGSSDFYPEEVPVRHVAVAPFRLDRFAVTNRAFARFVEETGYGTLAERPLDPQAYPGIDPATLQPDALVFVAPKRGATTFDVHDWWQYRPGTHWRTPEAGKSVFAGRLDHPVTCVAYKDAAAYAGWAKRRHMNRFEEADPHHLRDAACIVAVGLVDLLRLQQGLHVPGLDADYRKARFGQTVHQPLRQRPGSNPDPAIVAANGRQQHGYVIRLGRHLALAHDLARIVRHAHRRLLHRDVQTYEMRHRSHSFP